MEHIRVGHQHTGWVVSDFCPVPGGGVSVVDGGQRGRQSHEMAGQRMQIFELVLGQGLEREKKERPGVRIFQQAVQNRQGIDEGLAACRGCGHHAMPARTHEICGQCLVGVQPLHAQGCEHGRDLRVPGSVGVGMDGVFFRQYGMMNQIRGQGRVVLESGNIIVDHRWQPGGRGDKLFMVHCAVHQFHVRVETG